MWETKIPDIICKYQNWSGTTKFKMKIMVPCLIENGMRGDRPQIYVGLYGRWLIDKLARVHNDYVSGSNGWDKV